MVTADDFERRHGRVRGGRAEKGAHKGGLGGWLLGGVILAAGGGVAATNEDVRDAVLGFGRTAPVSGEARTTGAGVNEDAAVAARIAENQALRARIIDRINNDTPGDLSSFELAHLVIRRATPQEVASGVPADVVNYEYAVEGRNDLGEGTGVDSGQRRRGFYRDVGYRG